MTPRTRLCSFQLRLSGLHGWVLLVLLGLAASANAEPLPLPLQAILFKKVFVYNRTLVEKGKTVVSVLDDGSNSAAVVKALTDVGITARLTKAGGLSAESDATVVYVSQSSGEAKEFCVKAKVMCVSGNSALVEAGEVGLALRQSSAGKPEVVIHPGRAKMEGQELAADLLSISTLIK